MSLEKTPTVFVALMLAPEQLDLFEEIEAEAIDIFGDVSDARAHFASRGEDLVFLDHGAMRMALGWSTLPTGDALTLAVGAQPDKVLSREDARVAADMLRKLVGRAEALFDSRHALWQIALLPLQTTTMDNHAGQLRTLDPATGYQGGMPFVTVELDQPHAIEQPSAHSKTAEDYLSGIRAAFEDANDNPSWAMQASALALSTAFTLVTPPIGIAMFTYAALRQGKDMDLLPRNIDFPTSQPLMATG